MRDDLTREENANYEDYLELRRALRALADEVRLNIVRVLAGQGEVTVTELVARLLISQPLVSWHVAALRRAGLAHKRRQGREVYISLDRGRYHAVLLQLGALVSEASAPPPGGPEGRAGREVAAPADPAALGGR